LRLHAKIVRIEVTVQYGIARKVFLTLKESKTPGFDSATAPEWRGLCIGECRS